MTNDPNTAAAYNCLKNKDFYQANVHASKALEINPHCLSALAASAKALHFMQLHYTSLKQYEKIISITGKQTPPSIYLEAATQCTKIREYEDAIDLISKSNPNNENHAAAIQLAGIHAARGEFDKATITYRNILSNQPDHIQALLALAELGAIQIDSDLHLRLQHASEKLTGDIRAHCHYQLARIQKSIGNHHLFEQHLATALKEQQLYEPKHAAQHYIAEHDRHLESIQKFKHTKSSLTGSELKIIFIVGMPRTGTSLVESILSGHRDVEACGELDFFRNSIQSEYLRITGHKFPEGLENPKRQQLVLSEYLARLGQNVSNNATYVDKTPGNYLYSGHLLNIFPNCKIIHMQRDAMDTCFSILQQPFPGSSPHTYRMDMLAQSFAHEQQIMNEWKSRTGDRILSIRYEDLAHDPETHFEEIFNHCDLQWSKAYLTNTENRGATFTFSASQVRKSIANSSAGAWKPYGELLNPLKEALKSYSVGWSD